MCHRHIFAGIGMVLALACSRGLGQTVAADAGAADDGQWTMAAKNFSNTRFSGLKQITSDNVKSLKVAWTFSTGVNHGQEAAPIVIGSTMYVPTPFPNVLYALDVGQQGKLKWKFDPKPALAAQGEACCDSVTRGAAFLDGKVFINTLDGNTVAVDAQTGKEVWRKQLADYHIGEVMNMAPLAVKGKVIVGNSGGQFGVRGWIVALDAKSGNIAWKAYNTGPDSECLIGADFHPHYAMDQGKNLGVTSWPGEQWKLGGGTVWGWISYDPDQDLIFHGTGDPASWNADVRPGDNKWASGIFARRPDSGQAVWFYQYTQHDLYGHDGVNESIIADLALEAGAAPRKVLLHADRNGFFYVMDRQTGEVISATPFVRLTGYKGVDLKTGRIQFNDEKKPQQGKVIQDIAPAAPGGKDWQPAAYSPLTKLVYLPRQTLSMDFEETNVNYIAGTPYIGANAKFYPDPVDPGNGNMGAFTGWDPVAKKAVWNIQEKFPVVSGAMVTAGDVAFYGTMDCWFKAVDAHSGKELWRFKVDSGIVGQPITFLGPDGKQYVAILSGVGGWAGSVVSHDLDTADPTAAHGYANAMKELPKYTNKGGALYVFSLP